MAEHRQIWPLYLQSKLFANVIILLITEISQGTSCAWTTTQIMTGSPTHLSPHIHTLLPLSLLVLVAREGQKYMDSPFHVRELWEELPRGWHYWLARAAVVTVTDFRRVHCSSPRNISNPCGCRGKPWNLNSWQLKKQKINERNPFF